MMDGPCKRAEEQREAAMGIARKVAARSIVTKATERLIYQIVEVCAERERESVEAAMEASAKIADRMPDDAKVIAAAIRAALSASPAPDPAEAMRAKCAELVDKVDGLESDLSSALDVLWRRGGKGGRDWIWMNYRKFAALKGNGEGT